MSTASSEGRPRGLALLAPSPEHEVIVVDDGSSDWTTALTAATAETDPRFRLVRHEKNLGLAASTNEALGPILAPILVAGMGSWRGTRVLTGLQSARVLW